jgi:exodeoxyribonuclease-5
MRGEKLVALKNDRQRGIRNGTLWSVAEAGAEHDGFIKMAVANEAGHIVEVTAPIDGFTSTNGTGSDLPGQPFAFGYAITCHKSQGSQWGSVLVFDESVCFREHRWCWLYTAITRAISRVTVVR